MTRLHIGMLARPALPLAVCAVVGIASAPLAAYDVWKVATIVLSQLAGHAEGTDFLNLFSGAALLLQQPADTYRADAQLALQQSLTARDSLLVPFHLPPYAALLTSWLGWLAYGVAYAVWLLIGAACVLLSIHLVAPRGPRRFFRWSILSLLFLPVILGLAQGQTSALLLLAYAVVVRAFLAPRGPFRAALTAAVVDWLLKPQLAPVVLWVLFMSRRWRTLATVTTLVGCLTILAGVKLGPEGLAVYLVASHQKLQDALSGDPIVLIGPTLLHVSHWYFGVNATANMLAGVLVSLALGSVALLWRAGPAEDERILLQLAVLPIVSVISAAYGLVYELTSWLVSFWLLWRFTENRPAPRSALLWLTGGVWITGNLGVAVPRSGGADVAALFGLGVVAFIVWQFYAHAASRKANSNAIARR